MRFLTGKSIVVFGFILVLLVGIPSTIYLVQQQQDVRSRAEKTSNLTVSAAKTSVAVGEEFEATITLDPGKNFVTYLNVELIYDKSKLQIAPTNAYTPNSTAFPIPVRGPTYTDGKVVFSLQSSATDVTRTIRAATTVATIRFKALAPTVAGTPAFITFGSGSQAYSAGGTANGGSNDAYNENVLTGQFVPANITITDTGTSPSPSGVPITPTVSSPPSAGSSNGTAVTPTSPAPPAQQVVNPSPTAAANQIPTCLSLSLDRATTGTAPFDIALTVTGNDTDGNIGQVTFQYGDGPVENVTNGGGIGTNSISVQKTHTYHNPGVYQAYALLTDDKGALSVVGSCTQIITVTAAGAGTTQSSSGTSQTTSTTTTTTDGTGGTAVSQGTSNAATATLPKTGPNNLLVGLGAIGGGITLIGLILFFAL
jgi:hypothetical protein